MGFVLVMANGVELEFRKFSLCLGHLEFVSFVSDVNSRCGTFDL